MVSVMDIMQLCRLCLVKDQVNIPIFEEQGDIRQIFLKITACLPVKVSREDNLPKKICDGCLYKLELLYQFWNTTANAEKQLLSWLGQAGLEANTKTTDKAMEIVAQSHAHPHSEDAEHQIVLKQEALDPSDSRNDNMTDPITLETQSYVIQQQLPYDSFTFEQSDFVEAESDMTDASALIESESVNEPSAKRRRRAAAIKALPIVRQESEDEDIDDVGTMQITKTEEDSEEETIDDVEPTTFVGIPSNADNEQPGPSGVGKSPSEAPPVIEDVIVSLVDKSENKNNNVELQSKFLDLNTDRRMKVMFVCEFCGRKFWARNSLKLHKKMHAVDNAYRCDVCQKVYTTQSTLFKHKKSEHGDIVLFSCNYCDKVFFTRSILLKHIRTIHINKKEQCEICNQVFTSDLTLSAHIVLKHAGEKMPCTSCNIFFSSTSQYKRHVELVHKGIRYQCKVCNKLFNSKEALKEHSIMHDPTAPIFNCEPCNKTFRTPRTYKKHNERVHDAGRIPFICEICGKSVTSYNSLKNHMMTHTGEKPFICPVCEKRFNKRSLLRIHNRIHTKEKPHECKECKKRFSQRSSLVMHIRVVHTGEKPYACHLCPKKFPSRTLMNIHIRRLHGSFFNDAVSNQTKKSV